MVKCTSMIHTIDDHEGLNLANQKSRKLVVFGCKLWPIFDWKLGSCWVPNARE